MASISITSPTAGSTVNQMFTVTGTYQSNTTPTIPVKLKDSNGVTVATANGIPNAGNWTAAVVATQAYTGASVHASIDGTTASDSVGNITVQ